MSEKIEEEDDELEAPTPRQISRRIARRAHRLALEFEMKIKDKLEQLVDDGELDIDEIDAFNG